MSTPEITRTSSLQLRPRHPLALPSLLLCGPIVLGFFVPYVAVLTRSVAALLALLPLALLRRPAGKAGLGRSWWISLAGFLVLAAAPGLAVSIPGLFWEIWSVQVPLTFILILLILLYLVGLWGLGTFCRLMAGLCRAGELPKSAKLWATGRKAVLFGLLPAVAVAGVAWLVGVLQGIAWLQRVWRLVPWVFLLYTGLHLLVASVWTRVEAQGSSSRNAAS